MRRFARWLVRFAFALVVLGVAGLGVLAWLFWHYGQDLPDYRVLARYEPPTASRVYAGDGSLLAEYAREKRIFVPISAIPECVKQAFVAAEDRNFYHHFGLDPVGIVRAAIQNVGRLRSGRRPVGGSTITQQVAKNFLLSSEVSLERKIREAILALRIERAFTKERILELYLNEIYLGRRSYGVAMAALNYFDKSLDELTLGEIAFLAGLPKAPSLYDPEKNPEEAHARRDYVLQRMIEDGYITPEEAEAARAEPLVTRRDSTAVAAAPFFVEEVRRRLVERYGEKGFYEGGLTVRTTVDTTLQRFADHALREGLAAYDRRHGGWRGPLGRIDPGAPDVLVRLRAFDAGFELLDWRLALVSSVADDAAALLFPDGSTGVLPLRELAWARPRLDGGDLGPAPKRVSDVLEPGDVIVVAPVEGREGTFALRQRPEVEGAIVAMDPRTGRVLAMSGGFSFRQSWFNRATQAQRQPGSAFKPFVYLAALEHGYTPATIVLDAPIVLDQGPGLPPWKPENYSERFYGPSTLRLGLEKSRNLMTVRVALDIGMEPVIDVARRFGIGEGLQPLPSAALGSQEVTLLQLTTAYAMLANGGRRIRPVLVDRIQDRYGRTLEAADTRPCEGCRAEAWDGAPPPELPDLREQVADPRIVYQVVHMLEGVIENGTGEAARDLGRPLAGKTGTTNESRDAWFVGFAPDLVAGVWVGFDQPKSLGRRETGASVALPVWKAFMERALEGRPPRPFPTPPGVLLVRIDADTGLLPGPATRRVITEAFLPGTAPTTVSGAGSAPPDASGGTGAAAAAGLAADGLY
uniref:Penicillin-binding protein 1A n=1 Tax=uncultured Alphaproteobacteria bacterium TaxID=91750 RepID=H5SK15_9PROT|nr:penicillin-binding protein [uncultured Alphaproteobacteria bacterium]